MKIPTALHEAAPGVRVWSPGPGWGLANCILLADGSQGALIDTPYTTALAGALREAAGRLPHIGTIVNTHANGDHCYTNGEFKGPDTVVIAAEPPRGAAHTEPTPEQMSLMLADAPPDPLLARYLQDHFGVFDFRGMPRPDPPTRTITAEERIHVGSIPVRLLPAGPAHTVSDLIVHLPEQDIVAAGDIVFGQDHPVHWAGPLGNLLAACQSILDLQPALIVPGHGNPMLPADLRAHMDYLVDLRDHIHAAHAGGLDGRQAAASVHAAMQRDYPELGLPERTVVITHVEYAHLAKTPSADVLTLLARAAAHVPAPRTGD